MVKFRKLALLSLGLILIASIFISLLPSQVKAAPADCYWVGASGNWSDDDNHWAIISGGAPADGNLPDSSSNVHFDANSGFTAVSKTVTLDTVAYCNDMDWTGATNNPIVASNEFRIYGSVTLISGMTCPRPLKFYSTGSETIELGGVTVGSLYIEGAGTFTLQSNASAESFYFNAGTFNTGNFTVTSSLDVYVQGGAVNLGSSTVTIDDDWTYTSGTLNAGTSTIIFTGTNASSTQFTGGSQTYYDVQISEDDYGILMTGTNSFHDLACYGDATAGSYVEFYANQTITGTLTLDGNAANYRLMVRSNTLHTARTLTAATVSTSYADFRDITGAGAGSWDLSSGTAGDCGGNTNITFPTSRTVYAVNGNGNYDWSSGTHWSASSGGSANSAYFPRPHDTAVFDANSINVPGVVIGMDSLSISSIDATEVANTPTFQHYSGSQTMVYIYGSLELGTVVWDVDQTYMYGDLGYSLYSDSTIGGDLYVDTQIGSVTLASNITLLTGGGDLVLTSGVLNTADYDITCGTFNSSTGTFQRSFVMGDSTVTLNSTATVTKWNVNATNLSLYSNTSEIIFTNSSTNTQTFAGAGLTYYDFTIEGAGNYQTTITGTNTFNDMYIDRSQAAKTLAGNVTCTVNHLYIPISGTTVVTITNTDFVKSSGVVASGYLSISGSAASGGATFLAGTAPPSTDGGGNSGWTFADATPPTVVTQAATSLTSTGANLKGNLGNMGSFTGETVYVSFEYGLTDSYGTETAEQEMTATGDFNQVVSGLSPNTGYHYRARCRYSPVDYAYGSDVEFNTTGAPVVQTNDATNITSTSATLQGVLTSLGVYDECHVRFQYGLTVSYGIETGWQTFTEPSGFSADIYDLIPYETYHVQAMGLYSAASYVYGSDVTFTLQPEGVTTTITISRAGVFTSYLEDGDMLFCVEHYLKYTGYYPDETAGKWFSVQLLDTDGTTILAASPLANWGDRPSSIYVNATQAAGLVYGSAYYIRIIGDNIAGTPSEQYQLTTADWYGFDMRDLDDWCINTAIKMQMTDEVSNYITVLTDRGATITDYAGGYFTVGIPAISSVRPNLFTTSQLKPTFPSGADASTWDSPTAWETNVGTTIATDAGLLATPWGVTGKDILAILIIGACFLGMALITSATGGFGALGGFLIMFPILWAGTYFKIVPVIVVLFIAIIFGAIAVRQFVVKTL